MVRKETRITVDEALGLTYMRIWFKQVGSSGCTSVICESRVQAEELLEKIRKEGYVDKDYPIGSDVEFIPAHTIERITIEQLKPLCKCGCRIKVVGLKTKLGLK